jgi:septal ring factor EnvC (AmiA/AmiB activator)
MRKIVLLLLMFLFVSGCAKQVDNSYDGDIASLKQQLSVVSQKLETLNLEIATLKESITKLQESQGATSNQVNCHYDQGDNLSRCWFPLSQVGFVVGGQIPAQFKFVENSYNMGGMQLLIRYDDGKEMDEIAQFYVGKLNTEEQDEMGAKLISDLSPFRSVYSVVILDTNLSNDAKAIVDQWLQTNYSTIQRNHTKYKFLP